MYKFIIIILIVTALIIINVYQNLTIEKTDFKVESKCVPTSFNGFKIAQLSDIHNNYSLKVITMLETEQPDIVVITGDLIDSRHTDTDSAIEYIEKLVKIAPVYFITGNHEARFKNTLYKNFAASLTERGVVILDDNSVTLTRNDAEIKLIGLADPLFESYDESTYDAILKAKLEKINTNSTYNILLSHRPESFDVYVSENLDLVLSGHTHGGQIQLPFYGAVLTPTQGLFPEFKNGKYVKDNTVMYISRGIGCSVFPFRLFNHPELVIVTLESN